MSSPRGSGNPRKFDLDAYPQGGDFDLTSWILSVNFKSIWEVNHLFLLILTFILCPGVGILIFFLENVKLPTLCPTPPPPSGLTLIGVLLPGGLEYRHPTKYQPRRTGLNFLEQARRLCPWRIEISRRWSFFISTIFQTITNKQKHLSLRLELTPRFFHCKSRTEDNFHMSWTICSYKTLHRYNGQTLFTGMRQPIKNYLVCYTFSLYAEQYMSL